ncbi:hypothetical protein B0H14DRAFT_2801248, partial [Mycena olivaceomarginata]
PTLCPRMPPPDSDTPAARLKYRHTTAQAHTDYRRVEPVHRVPALCLALSPPSLRCSSTLPSALAICSRSPSPSGRSLPMRRSIDVLYALAGCAASRTALSPDLQPQCLAGAVRAPTLSPTETGTQTRSYLLILYPSSYFPSPPRNPDSSLFAPAP